MNMKYTSFESLERAVSKLGAKPVVAELNEELIGSGLDIVDPEQVVVSNSGIYYLDPEGVVTQVILHMVDKKIDGRYSQGLDELVKKETFNDERLINKLHKFHLVNCQTMQKSQTEGWYSKYKMSRRLTGKFYYRFIEGNKVIKENNQQILPVCKNCIDVINTFPDSDFNFKRSNFDLKTFFDHTSYKTKGLKKAPLACGSVPNLYQSDWKDISARYRELKKYQCEGNNCPSPDLSNNKRYLHTHHVNMDKSNNAYSNLRVLCIYCHANQPNHEHIKMTPEYKDYLATLGRN